MNVNLSITFSNSDKDCEPCTSEIGKSVGGVGHALNAKLSKGLEASSTMFQTHIDSIHNDIRTPNQCFAYISDMTSRIFQI